MKGSLNHFYDIQATKYPRCKMGWLEKNTSIHPWTRIGRRLPDHEGSTTRW